MKNLCIFLLQVSLLITTNVAMGSQAVLKTYADIAEAVYEDSLDTAKVLKSAVNQFINNPTEYNHQNAKDA